jgi:hypothetical protein
MENKITYNAKNFYSIELKDAERDYSIEYKPAKKRIFGKLKPEHYECDYTTPSRWDIDDHENTHFIGEDRNVFLKPHVLTTMQTDNEKYTTYNYFITFKEANIYYSEIIASLKKQKVKFIELKTMLL